MAQLNGKTVDFAGLSLEKIGEKLLEDSPNKDGRGIHLTLTREEEAGFEDLFGLSVGRRLCNLVEDAAKAKDAKTQLGFVYNSLIFTTS